MGIDGTEAAPVPVQYPDRGWGFFEQEASLLKSDASSRSSWYGNTDRFPALCPDDFSNLLTGKTFTNGTDGDVVNALYCRLFNQTALQKNSLALPGPENPEHENPEYEK